MKSSEFNKKCVTLLLENGATKKVGHWNDNAYNINTSFGNLQITIDQNCKNVYSIYMRFTNKFDINIFYKYYETNFFFKYINGKQTINRFSKKWNIHEFDAITVLDGLENRLIMLNRLYSELGILIDLNKKELQIL